jgi:DNA gyrase subunit A
MTEAYLHSLESVPLQDIVKEEYRIYQIYTLMDRAIPYLQDGLKPSQRRILFTLWKNQSKGLIKVSSLTGLVLTLHPHGPASVEQSVVNLAQDYTFSNNYPLIDKKGYFGERMETQAAAGRYIECKLGKIAQVLLFDDMNQVEMIPNYDEKVMEPLALFPKLPIMILNGAEGIGTGFSSQIPSFNHKDIISSMKMFMDTGKPKKLRPYIRYYSEKIEVEKSGRILYPLGIKEIDGKIVITELPKGWDAKRVYRHLHKFIDSDYLRDYTDSSVDNTIQIELIFKRGKQPKLKDVRETMKATGTMVPNYTLISQRGVKVLDKAEDIIELFTAQRVVVVRRRYELLIEDYEARLKKNNEIIRFIKERHYAQAEKQTNRKTFVEYLVKKKFTYADYLADMAIYRMTKEEVSKRLLLIKEETKELKEFRAIAKSPARVKKKLIEELNDVDKKLDDIIKQRDDQRKKAFMKTRKKKKVAKKKKR